MTQEKNKLTEETPEPQGVSLQAIDILQQTFTVKFRGYDTQDVDSFLEIVSREIERLSGKNIQLAEDLKKAQEELSVLRKKEENVNAALITVQNLTGEVKQKAKAEADRLLQEARDKARDIVTNAQTQMQTQKDESALLRDQEKNEAQHRIDEARQEADRIINDAHAKASQRREEADSIKDQSQEKARVLLEDSHKQADAILEQARAKKTELEDELTMLRQQKIQFETSFRTLIETHLQLMESNESDKTE